MNPCFTPYRKVNSKWVKHLNVRTKTTKLLEENIGRNLCELELGNGFLDITPKPQAKKEKIDKFDFIKFKTFSASRDYHQENEKTVYRMGENICKSHS